MQINIYTIVLGIVALLVLIFLVKSAGARGRSVGNTPKGLVVTVLAILFAGAVIGAIAIQGVPLQIGGLSVGDNINQPADNQPSAPATGECPYQPTGTYSGVDKYTAVALTGTSEYQLEGKAMSTTALSNLPEGATVSYWISNATYYVSPLTQEVGCGNNQFQVKGIANASSQGVPTVYDVQGHQTVTNGVANVTLGAGGSNSFEITFTGVSQKALMPFGGVLVVEFNATAFAGQNVIVSGDDIVANDGTFHVTYTPSATTNTYKVYKVLASLDDQSGKPKQIDESLSASASVDPNSRVIYTFYPANYYIGNDGNLHLDVEKYSDGSTTKVGLGSLTVEHDIA